MTRIYARARFTITAAAAAVLLAGCATPPTLGDAVVEWVAGVCAEAPEERASIVAEVSSVTAPHSLAVDCAR